MGFWVGKVVGKHQYEPATFTKWLMPKDVSGNDFNGLGREDVYRPPSHFHGPNWHPWKKVANLFGMRAVFGRPGTIVSIMKHKFRETFLHVKIAEQKAEGTAESFSRDMKRDVLKSEYVEMIGITRMKSDYMFAGQDGITSPWVVVVALSMDYDELAKNLEPFSRVPIIIAHSSFFLPLIIV